MRLIAEFLHNELGIAISRADESTAGMYGILKDWLGILPASEQMRLYQIVEEENQKTIAVLNEMQSSFEMPDIALDSV